MKIWTAPEIQEMDVRLTAKVPCTVESSVESPNCRPVDTYNSLTHEVVNGIIQPKDPSKFGPGS